MSVVALPDAPAPLPADTYPARHRIWWEQCDVLLRQAAVAVAGQQATAQMNTAEAMQDNAMAQRQLAEVIAAGPPAVLPTRAELAFAILRDHPQATILTNGQLVSGAAGIVEAYAQRFPAAVQA